MPDHVHLFIEVDPTFAPSTIIKRIKGRASHHLRKELTQLLKLPSGLQVIFVRPQAMLAPKPSKNILKIKRESSDGLKPVAFDDH